MRVRNLLCLAFVLPWTGVAAQELNADQHIITRGDANMDGVVDVSDAVFIDSYLFRRGPEPLCMNQADVDNDGTVAPADAVFLLEWLYNGGAAPPYPGPHSTRCVADDEPYPGCKVSPCDPG